MKSVFVGFGLCLLTLGCEPGETYDEMKVRETRPLLASYEERVRPTLAVLAGAPGLLPSVGPVTEDGVVGAGSSLERYGDELWKLSGDRLSGKAVSAGAEEIISTLGADQRRWTELDALYKDPSNPRLMELNVADLLERVAKVRRLLVTRTLEYRAPQLDEAKQTFSSGFYRAEVLVWDVEGPRYLGGFRFEAENSGLIGLPESGGLSYLVKDLGSRAREAYAKAFDIHMRGEPEVESETAEDGGHPFRAKSSEEKRALFDSMAIGPERGSDFNDLYSETLGDEKIKSWCVKAYRHLTEAELELEPKLRAKLEIIAARAASRDNVQQFLSLLNAEQVALIVAKLGY